MPIACIDLDGGEPDIQIAPEGFSMYAPVIDGIDDRQINWMMINSQWEICDLPYPVTVVGSRMSALERRMSRVIAGRPADQFRSYRFDAASTARYLKGKEDYTLEYATIGVVAGAVAAGPIAAWAVGAGVVGAVGSALTSTVGFMEATFVGRFALNATIDAGGQVIGNGLTGSEQSINLTSCLLSGLTGGMFRGTNFMQDGAIGFTTNFASEMFKFSTKTGEEFVNSSNAYEKSVNAINGGVVGGFLGKTSGIIKSYVSHVGLNGAAQGLRHNKVSGKVQEIGQEATENALQNILQYEDPKNSSNE
jgi:hypothetical protein